MNNKSLMNSYPVKQQGVGLIDVMIAVVIFSIGLLAISAHVRMSFVESFGKSRVITAAIEGANKMIVSKELSIVSLPTIEWLT